MAKDALGNDLQVGDYVEIHLNHPRIYARVTDVRDGGTVIRGLRSGGDQRTMGNVALAAKFDLPFHPDNPAVDVVKLCDPTPEEAEKVRQMAGIVEGKLSLM